MVAPKTKAFFGILLLLLFIYFRFLTGVLRSEDRGWRDGSAVKSTDCSFEQKQTKRSEDNLLECSPSIMWVLGIKLGLQAWEHAPLPTEPSFTHRAFLPTDPGKQS